MRPTCRQAARPLQHKPRFRMKKLFLLCCLYGCCAAQAQTVWFNILGDPGNDRADTVEVDPTPVAVEGNTRLMRVRVSRATNRLNWDSLPYRSYVSEVVFDCTRQTARYVSVDYYTEPAWRGKPYKRVLYSHNELRRMLLRDMSPNPHQRIIRAVCQTASITSN